MLRKSMKRWQAWSDSNGNEPMAVNTAVDVAQEEWVELLIKARKFAHKESWKRC